MSKRDPRLNPMPGDILETKSGSVWYVIDEFISVLRSGEERIGLRVVIERRGERKLNYIGPGTIRRRLGNALIVKRSSRKKLHLKVAPRVRHTEDHSELEAAFVERPVALMCEKRRGLSNHSSPDA